MGGGPQLEEGRVWINLNIFAPQNKFWGCKTEAWFFRESDFTFIWWDNLTVSSNGNYLVTLQRTTTFFLSLSICSRHCFSACWKWVIQWHKILKCQLMKYALYFKVPKTRRTLYFKVPKTSSTYFSWYWTRYFFTFNHRYLPHHVSCVVTLHLTNTLVIDLYQFSSLLDGIPS